MEIAFYFYLAVGTIGMIFLALATWVFFHGSDQQKINLIRFYGNDRGLRVAILAFLMGFGFLGSLVALLGKATAIQNLLTAMTGGLITAMAFGRKNPEISNTAAYVMGNLFNPPEPLCAELRRVLDEIAESGGAGGYRFDLPHAILELRAEEAEQFEVPVNSSSLPTKAFEFEGLSEEDRKVMQVLLRLGGVLGTVKLGLRMRVVDPTRFAGVKKTFEKMIQGEAITSMKQVIGSGYDIFALRTAGENLAKDIRRVMTEGHGKTLAEWGVELLEANVEEAKGSPEFEKTLESLQQAVVSTQELRMRQGVSLEITRQLASLGVGDAVLNHVAAVVHGVKRTTVGIDGAKGDLDRGAGLLLALMEEFNKGKNTGGKPPGRKKGGS